MVYCEAVRFAILATAWLLVSHLIIRGTILWVSKDGDMSLRWLRHWFKPGLPDLSALHPPIYLYHEVCEAEQAAAAWSSFFLVWRVRLSGIRTSALAKLETTPYSGRLAAERLEVYHELVVFGDRKEYEHSLL